MERLFLTRKQFKKDRAQDYNLCVEDLSNLRFPRKEQMDMWVWNLGVVGSES